MDQIFGSGKLLMAKIEVPVVHVPTGALRPEPMIPGVVTADGDGRVVDVLVDFDSNEMARVEQRQDAALQEFFVATFDGGDLSTAGDGADEYNGARAVEQREALGSGFNENELVTTLFGNDLHFQLFGLGGNDRLTGGNNTDRIFGGDGNDKLVGLGGDDLIDGGNGNDTITGNTGNDLLLGGAGEDEIEGGAGNDSIDGGSDDDELSGEAGDDVINGGAGNDDIEGGGGNDVIDGNEGDDDISGGDGNDAIRGSAGFDVINGNAGDDLIDGGDDRDVIDGGDGNDAITAGAGDDDAFGADGDDTIVGGDGDDFLLGEAGNDRVDGGNGDDFVAGDDGADILTGGAGSDFIDGGFGDDVIDGGSDLPPVPVAGVPGLMPITNEIDNDVLIGGGGNDIFYYATDAVNSYVGDDLIVDFISTGLGEDQLNLSCVANLSRIIVETIDTFDPELDQTREAVVLSLEDVLGGDIGTIQIETPDGGADTFLNQPGAYGTGSGATVQVASGVNVVFESLPITEATAIIA